VDMESSSQSDLRLSNLAKSEEEVAFLRRHLKEIVAGAAFRGSPRSAQFLTYIVEQSIAGNFDSLKERAIGMELFGRSPSYDTGEDAIVRVTASDVRKRLLQHYGKDGVASQARLTLPLGSYIPEFRRDPRSIASNGNLIAASSWPILPIASASAAVAPPAVVPHLPTAPARRYGLLKWLLLAILLTGWIVALWVVFRSHAVRTETKPVLVLPWSAFFGSRHSIRVVASDPNIEEIQQLTGEPITLSDYANQRYIPDPGGLSPEIIRIGKDFLPGDMTSAIDTGVAVRISALAAAGSIRTIVQVARGVRLSDVYTAGNFVFLGSPRSNPWVGLFDDQLDFRFAMDSSSGQEIIRNFHPRSSEKSSYIPTAKGYATGESFATISFLPNPTKTGQILLLAGANGEGTAAAGELITNLQSLSAELKNCGIAPSGAVKYFQLLLRLNTMAGTPSHVQIIACHILPVISP
jgi:hypothetical protein